ncbi:MAG: ATP-binding protein [Armatimonadetes bacterium]|nr:ATP-binding protein [Armatimonadota bacterium]
MATERFVGRKAELQALGGFYARPGAQLFVLYGRRRVGKTELVRQFCRNRRHLYFQAAQEPDHDNLSHFAAQAARATGNPLFRRAHFTRWEDALQQVAESAGQERLVVVLDEFPWLCEANRGLPSLLQRFWDHHGQSSSLFLILCGSSIGFMEEGVLAYRSPLFGRRTGQQELLPLTYREAAEFVGGYSPADRLRAYALLGGIPMYLQQFSDRRPLRDNVQQEILLPQALLHNEPSFLLQSELRDPRIYNSILQAIASGLTKHNEIAQRVDPRPGAISRYLERLEQLRLVQRVVPVADRAPGRRTRGRYFLRDNFLRFWYRFVMPNRSLLELGETAQVWRDSIAPQLDAFVGPAFEHVCREYIRRHWREKLPVPAQSEVGRHWAKDVEIDLLCRNADGSHYCGECKWTIRPVGIRVLEELRLKTQSLPPAWRRKLRHVIFSRAGFTEALRAQADGENVILVDLAELYGVE